jgi:hypothetical protein
MNVALCFGRLWVKVEAFYRKLCPTPKTINVSIFNQDNSVEAWTITDDIMDYLEGYDYPKLITVTAKNDIKNVVRIFIDKDDLEDIDNVYDFVLNSKRPSTEILDFYVMNGEEIVSIIDSLLPYLWSGNVFSLDTINTVLETNYEVIFWTDIDFEQHRIDKDATLVL